MTPSNNPSTQRIYLKEIVNFAVKDDNFRNAVFKNSREAINSKHAELGFGYDELTNDSREVLDSLSSEELDELHTIFKKGKTAEAATGIGPPPEMF